MGTRRVAAAAVLALLAAGCGSAGSARSVATRPRVASSTTTASTTTATTTTTALAARKLAATTPSPKDAAEALSQRMAGEAILPPGSTRTHAPLPPELRGPWEQPAGGNLVGARRAWFVTLDPDAVVTFLKAHTPAGFIESGVGTMSSPTTSVMDVVDVLKVVPAHVAIAGMEIGVEGHGTGSLVNVVAGVQWTQLRPADEHVGARDGTVVVSEIPLGGGPPVRRVVVTGSRRSAIVAAFNTLSVSPPLVEGGCFALGVDAVSYRVTFATSATAPPDVVATIAPCSPISVLVGGHRSANLSPAAGDFGNAVAHALGASALTFSPSTAD